MSLRLEMLQVARLAPSLLGESTGLIREFIGRSQLADGGFTDRDGRSDLYYTSFAVDALTALQAEVPEDRLVPYLQAFGDGEGLDLVHLCCLGRVWSAMRSERLDAGRLEVLLSRIEAFRTEDGGYDQAPTAKRGSAYGCLLGYGAYADQQRQPPHPEKLLTCLEALQTRDGAWSNDLLIRIGSGPATAAAVTLCRNLRHPIPDSTAGWLLGCFHPEGGFRAIPNAPMPDLLSTAVILHALDGLQVPLVRLKEPCLDFIDSLWTNGGGFHGNWSDDVLDLEYTYYGLLALGHLAL